MEILFNNEEQFQPGSFFSIRQEVINGKTITVVKTGNLKDIDKTMSYQLRNEEIKALANLCSLLLENPEYLLNLRNSSLPCEEAVIVE